MTASDYIHTFPSFGAFLEAPRMEMREVWPADQDAAIKTVEQFAVATYVRRVTMAAPAAADIFVALKCINRPIELVLRAFQAHY